jgi:hypothetical protein
LDARHQLAGFERLRQVIVRAQLQAEHAIGNFAARRQHDDGHGIIPADLPAHLEAVLAGQHHIEDDDVRQLAPKEPDGLVGMEGWNALQSELGEIIREQAPQLLVVVDDQYGLHGRRPRFVMLGGFPCRVVMLG